jgi:hypothetical protein
MAQTAQYAQNPNMGQPNASSGMDINDISMPIGFDSHSLLYSIGAPDGGVAMGPGPYHNMPGLVPPGVDINQLDWSAMDWDFVKAPADESIGLSLPY